MFLVLKKKKGNYLFINIILHCFTKVKKKKRKRL